MKATLRILARAATAMRFCRSGIMRGRRISANVGKSRSRTLERLEDRTLLSGAGLSSAEDGDAASYPYSETFDESSLWIRR